MFCEQNPSNPSYHGPKNKFEISISVKLNRLRGVEISIKIFHLFSIDASIELVLRFTFSTFLHLFLGAIFIVFNNTSCLVC